VPGRLDTGRPGQRSWTVLAVVRVTSGDVVRLAWCDQGAVTRTQVAPRRSGLTVDDGTARQRHNIDGVTLTQCQMDPRSIWYGG